MKKTWKLILIIFVVVFIVIQLVPVNRNNPSSKITSEIQAPPEVMSILKTSCYDCHSNETVWPFYSYIAPVSWFTSNHVKEGRKELNFSEWMSYSSERQQKKIKEIQEEVSGEKMPLPVYLLIHDDAVLTPDQKIILHKWSSSINIKDAENNF